VNSYRNQLINQHILTYLKSKDAESLFLSQKCAWLISKVSFKYTCTKCVVSHKRFDG